MLFIINPQLLIICLNCWCDSPHLVKNVEKFHCKYSESTTLLVISLTILALCVTIKTLTFTFIEAVSISWNLIITCIEVLFATTVILSLLEAPYVTAFSHCMFGILHVISHFLCLLPVLLFNEHYSVGVEICWFV